MPNPTERHTVPGSTIRTLIPMKGVDYALTVTDRGAVATQAGITFTLPEYFQPTLGESCFIVNISSGDINANTVNGDVIKTSGGDQTSVVIPPNSSRSFLRETDTLQFVATGAPQTLSQSYLNGLIDAAVASQISGQSTVMVKGDPGAKGETGADGKSAYQIAVENGFMGSVFEWLVSLKGVPGKDGVDGVTPSDSRLSNLINGLLPQAVATYEQAHPGFSGNYDDLAGKPSLFSGSYADLSNKPTIPAAQIQSDWSQASSSALDYIKNKPTLFSGAYGDLTGKPSLFSGVYADLTGKPTLFSGAYSDLTGKPSLFSGSYNDLTDKPSIPSGQVQSNWTQADNTALDFIRNKPTLFSGVYADLTGKPVLFSGAYVDLSGKPTLFSGAYADLTGKPLLATVATSGAYADLSGKPTIPAAQVNSDWTAVSGVSQILNKPTLATVATSGSYSDLSNRPTIPSAQVQSDWNAVSGIGVILNKPSIPAASMVAVNAPITNAGTTTAANLSISPATASAAGSMSAVDKTKVDAIPAGVKYMTLAGQVTLGQTAAIAIAVGIREVTTALTGTVAGARYLGFVRSYQLNGGAVTAGRPAGYALVDTVCNTVNNITVSLNAPLLAIGQSYSLVIDVIAIP